MARFYGRVFYETTENVGVGIEAPVLTPKYYYGDINRISRRYESGDVVNQNLTLSHEISIVADAYAFDNYANIKCVEIDGHLWAANYVEVNRPRIKITIGGLYNEHPRIVDDSSSESNGESGSE